MRETLALLLLCALTGCMSSASEQNANPPMTLRIATQFLGSCNEQASTHGDNQFPPGVERLKIVVYDGTTAVLTKTFTKSNQAKTGEIVVEKVPSGKSLRVEVHGCASTGTRVTWSGAIDKVQVSQFGKVAPELFITKRDSFNCTGSQATDNGIPLGKSTLPKSVAFHTATTLPNGLVLIAGGSTTFNNADGVHESTDVAALYHPNAGVFEHLSAKLVSKRAYHRAVNFKINGEEVVLLIGGLGKATVTNVNSEFPVTPSGSASEFQVTPIEVFHLASKSFVALNGVDIPWRLYPAVATSADLSTLIVAGGANVANVATDDLFIWSGGTVVHSKMRTRRVGHSIVRLSNGAFLIWGGNVDGVKENFGELLLPGAQTTTRLTLLGSSSIPDPHALHSFTLVNGRYVVVGGNTITSAGRVSRASASVSYVLDFNESSNSVTATALTPSSAALAQRSFHTAVAVGKNLFIAGGQTHFTFGDVPPVVIGKVFVDGNTLTFDKLITIADGATVSLPSTSIGLASAPFTDGSVGFFGGLISRESKDQLLDITYVWSPPISEPTSCD